MDLFWKVLVPFFLCISLGIPAGDPSREAKEILHKFKFNPNQEYRMQLLSKLGEMPEEPAAVEALLDAFLFSSKRIPPLEKKIESLDRESEPFQREERNDADEIQLRKIWKEQGDLYEKIENEKVLLGEVENQLKKIRGDRAFSVLLKKGLGSADWELQALSARVLGALGRKEAVESLLDVLKSKNVMARMGAVEGLGGLLSEPDALGGVIQSLEDRAWQVRLCAINALSRSRRWEAAGPLILALQSEEGRLIQEIIAGLQELTGQNFGNSCKAWLDWWEANRKEGTIEIKAEKVKVSPPAGFRYHGIQTYSRRVVFVIDISDSMNDPADLRELPKQGIPRRVGVERSKLEVVKEELTRTIVGMDPNACFNLVFYNHVIKIWNKSMVPATKKNKNDALRAILTARASGATNIFGALEAALKMGGIGVEDKHYRSNVDTLFFLSDGAPSEGKFIKPEDILREVQRMNEHRKVILNAVGVGHLHDRDFMSRLAQQTGGEYVRIL